MAQLWRHDGQGWSAVGLDALADRDAATTTAIVRSDAAVGGLWVLVTPAGELAVNGSSVTTGLAVLADRDEILRPDGTRFFFAIESAPVVELLRVPPTDLRCPRCRRGFEPDTPVVRCPGPGCGVIHHESERLPCFTYHDCCAVCPQPTARETAAPRWTPEEL